MAFNSPLFLFVFVPVFFAVYLACGERLRSAWLMLGSGVFYLWGAPLYFVPVLALILANFGFARWIERARSKPSHFTSGRVTALALALNLGVLVLFKFLAAYAAALALTLQQVRALHSLLPVLQNFPFPLGLSFMIFGLVSYQVDVYKQRALPETSLLRFAQVVLLFPKLIAGPIVRYRDILPQFGQRVLTAQCLADGLRRFITGLAKKVLIADQLGLLVDRGIFERASPHLPPGLAWLVLLSYALQIFFDFSGYSDMAIGLAQMLGFKFGENFNYPYISKSITEFWRRWHISLSSWFRDYLFYPLERQGGGRSRQYFNILLVFLATGLWHGLTLNFAAWGLLHGLAIALERGPFGRWLKTTWAPLQHVYTLLVLLTGWVFFRSASLPFALGFIKTLLGLANSGVIVPYSEMPPFQLSSGLALAAGVLFSTPAAAWLTRKTGASLSHGWLPAALTARDVLLLGLLLLSLVVLAGASFKPYIYGNF